MKNMRKNISAIAAVIFLLVIIVMAAVMFVQARRGAPFSNDRFEIVEKERNLYGGSWIIHDRETNVLYLWVECGYQGGLTPLLDQNGEVTFYR